ncbi:septation protein IspZ [Psychrobacter sp. I-STPA10]|uniref:septation protein IspZ n=1 Tax=Psychrobacter sp. I-STPA10 TaxID=2585769 RepID=UPI001E5DBAC1|nr:septation protein IspZ [Psychrobacter sp. I-STPA10]
MKALLDFIPLIAFFIAAKQYGILAGAGALLVATLAVYSLHLLKQKGKLDKQQWVTLILTILFCGLTLILRDKIFLQWKSTVINAIFAVALIISVIVNRPLLQMAMKTVFRLTPSGWNKLTLAWAGYFILMAGLQYYFAFYTSEQTWIDFKTYGWIPFMLVFMIGQFVILKNHLNPEITEQKQPPKD